MPQEAVFQTCRIWTSGPCKPYRVQPLLCEEWLETGVVTYAIYFLDVGSTSSDIRQTFRELPEGVQKLIMLWKEPAWDAEYRERWAIHRTGAASVDVPDPEHHADEGQDLAQHEHSSSNAVQNEYPGEESGLPVTPASSGAATVLGTELSDSPRSIEAAPQPSEGDRAASTSGP